MAQGDSCWYEMQISQIINFILCETFQFTKYAALFMMFICLSDFPVCRSNSRFTDKWHWQCWAFDTTIFPHSKQIRKQWIWAAVISDVIWRNNIWKQNNCRNYHSYTWWAWLFTQQYLCLMSSLALSSYYKCRLQSWLQAENHKCLQTMRNLIADTYHYKWLHNDFTWFLYRCVLSTVY